jgi:hypothetical protein
MSAVVSERERISQDEETPFERAEREKGERPSLVDQSIIDPAKLPPPQEGPLYPKEGADEGITIDRISRNNPFHVNRAARDSRNESLYAKRMAHELSEMGEDLVRTIEQVKALPAQLSQAVQSAHAESATTAALEDIASSLSNLRDRVATTFPSSGGLSSALTAPLLGRNEQQPLHQIAIASQMGGRPDPVTFMDTPVHELIQTARGSLTDITASLNSVEARLVAQCSLSPSGNEESLYHLDLLRSVKERVEEVDQKLRDMQPT